MLSKSRALREFFNVLAIIITPIVIGCIVILVFSLPGQSLEVFRTSALNARSPFPDPDLRVILYLSVMAVLLLSAATFLACRLMLSYFRTELALNSRLGEVTIKWAPYFTAFLPFLAVAAGAYRAIPLANKAGAERDAMRERLADEYLNMAELSIFNPSSRHSAFRVIDNILGGMDSFLWRGTIGAIVFGLLFLAVLYVAERYISKAPLAAQDRARAILLAVAGVGLFALFVSMVIWPDPVSRKLGPVVVICLFSILLLGLFSTLSFYSRKLRFPFTFLVLVYMIVLSVAGLNDNHHIRYLPEDKSKGIANTAALPGLKECFELWYKSRPDRLRFEGTPNKYPVYIVAAQGGGIFAAHHAAVFLANAQKEIPAFQHHLFAISSVSGGSVGAAVYTASLQVDQAIHSGGASARPASGASTSCRRSAVKQRGPNNKPAAAGKFNLLNFVDNRVFSHDLLSPLVGAMTFPDFLQRFIPFAVPRLDRARSLEYGLEYAWSEALAAELRKNKTIKGPVKGSKNLLAKPYIAHWQAAGSLPALIINTTEVGSGRRRIFAPFEFAREDLRFFSSQVAGRASLSTAAVLSARFPWITPAGWITDKDAGVGKRRFVDGGYFENSGIVTALQLYVAIKKAAGELNLQDKIDVKIIALTGDPKDVAYNAAAGLNELGDPIRTLLTTMSSRGHVNIRDVQRQLNGGAAVEKKLFRVTLRKLRYPLPLGWMISDVTRIFIRMQRGDPAYCSKARPAAPGKPRLESDADCVIAYMKRTIGRAN